jgi:hypothetical protein
MKRGSVERALPPVRDNVPLLYPQQRREPGFGRVFSMANRQASLNATRPVYFAEVSA